MTPLCSGLHLIRYLAEDVAKEGGPADFEERAIARVRREFVHLHEQMSGSGEAEH